MSYTEIIDLTPVTNARQAYRDAYQQWVDAGARKEDTGALEAAAAAVKDAEDIWAAAWRAHLDAEAAER